MKHKVSELEGALLDAAVAVALGWEREGDYWVRTVGFEYGANLASRHPVVGVDHWKPSSSWEQGGPIIERERIATLPLNDGGWQAGFAPQVTPETFGGDSAVLEMDDYSEGATSLIAAMRAYVANRLGE